MSDHETKWLIYSREHEMWWKPNSRGYTRDEKQAGRYAESDARRICEVAGTDQQYSVNEFCYPAPESIPLPAPPAPAGGEDEDAEWLGERLQLDKPMSAFWPHLTRIDLDRFRRIAARLESHAALEAERDRLREALEELRDDCQWVIDNYHANGPGFTSPHASEYYSASYVLNSNREMLAEIEAALRPPQTEAEE